MTNRSISLLAGITGKSLAEKEKITKEIVTIEYEKIIAQAKNFIKLCSDKEQVKTIASLKDPNELFDYLNNLNIVEISILSAYGIDVAFMNVLKVSE